MFDDKAIKTVLLSTLSTIAQDVFVLGEKVTAIQYGYSTSDLSRPSWYEAKISAVHHKASIRSNVYDLEFLDGTGDVEMGVYQCYIRKYVCL
jgi:hypothetical protein